MHVQFYETEAWEEEYLKAHLPGHIVTFSRNPLAAPPRKLSAVDVISPFIYSAVDVAVLDHLPGLKLIATRSTGFDHIDLDACSARGVAVANVPSYGENTVAEHAFALILTLSRHLYEAFLGRLENDFTVTHLTGFDLKGRTIGVVGTGRIGLHVIRIARGFGMHVLAFDVHPSDILAEVLGFQYVPLDQLLGQSDIVSLHVPYNKATHHLLDARKFEVMKKGSYLINTARGGIVDQGALLAALDDGTLAGAGLDVLEGEEYIKEEKAVLTDTNRADVLGSIGQNALILRHRNVVYTPHIGFNSHEALVRILDTTIANINDFAAGTPRNIVNAGALKSTAT